MKQFKQTTDALGQIAFCTYTWLNTKHLQTTVKTLTIGSKIEIYYTKKKKRKRGHVPICLGIQQVMVKIGERG